MGDNSLPDRAALLLLREDIDDETFQVVQGILRGYEIALYQRHREVERARQAARLLREGERLVRNNPDMQNWRKRAGAFLQEFHGPYELRAPDSLGAEPKGVDQSEDLQASGVQTRSI